MIPRFVPFESMSDAEQREHLRRVHGIDASGFTPTTVHLFANRWALAPTPHTHDKPAPRPEENR